MPRRRQTVLYPDFWLRLVSHVYNEAKFSVASLRCRMTQLIKVASWTGEKRINIVFVHGLGGHPYGTWQNGSSRQNFWPRWMAEDIPGATVFTLGYFSPASNWVGSSLPILDEAVSISRLLANEAELSSGPIVFVCHSLGGLLIKQFLRDANERADSDRTLESLFRRTKIVMFLGTPHTGSGKATWLERFRLFAWGSNSAKDLVANNATLRNLNTGYRGVAERRSDLQHVVYYETQNTAAGRIVDPASSDPGLPNCRPIPIRAHHTSLSKPVGKDALIYSEIKNTIGVTFRHPADVGTPTFYSLPSFDLPWHLPGILAKLIRLALILLFFYFCIGLIVVLFNGSPRTISGNLNDAAITRDLRDAKLNYFTLNKPPRNAMFIIYYSKSGRPLSSFYPEFAGPFPDVGNKDGDAGSIWINVTDTVGATGTLSVGQRGPGDKYTSVNEKSGALSQWFSDEFSPVFTVGVNFKEALQKTSMRRILSELSSMFYAGGINLKFDGDDKKRRELVDIMLSNLSANFKFYVHSKEAGDDDCASVIYVPVILQEDVAVRESIRIDLIVDYKNLDIERCEKLPF